MSVAMRIEERWQAAPFWVRLACGMCGSAAVVALLWQTVLLPLEWPRLSRVLHYLAASAQSFDTYKAAAMTAARATVVMMVGFPLAVMLAVLTGRTILGWCAFFFLLLALQKVPAIAMVDVLVKSKIGIGFGMTTVLGTIVVTTFVWLVVHHRVSTLDARELFALRVVGFRGWRLFVYSILPHIGSSIGASARLAMSIATVMVVLGEWRGVWDDGSLLSYGLGVNISAQVEAWEGQAQILATCVWLGIVGVTLDALVQGTLMVLERVAGVSLRR